MKRRNFLKLLGLSPLVPSVLMAKLTTHRPEDIMTATEILNRRAEIYGLSSVPKIWTEMWDCDAKTKVTFDENMVCVKREEFEQFPFVVFTGEQSCVNAITFVERRIYF
jgi:hypothetical protein